MIGRWVCWLRGHRLTDAGYFRAVVCHRCGRAWRSGVTP